MELRHGTPKEAVMSSQRVQHVVDLAGGWVAQGVHPALVVLAARRGVIFLHEASGCLTPEPDSPPLELDSLFNLSSLSKPITTMAAMFLVEDGLLGLNRPVQEYIPEFTGEGKEQVTVHHLLTHTSGLSDEDLFAHAEKKGDVEIPPTEEGQHPEVSKHLFLGYDTPLTILPGVEQRYCNFGIDMAGEIVRRVSEKSLGDFSKERLFKPLGMKDTCYGLPDAMWNRVVKRTEDAPDAQWFTQEALEVPWGASGVISTAMDTAIMGQMLLNGGVYGDTRVLSLATVTAMTRNQIPGIGARWFDEFSQKQIWVTVSLSKGIRRSSPGRSRCSPRRLLPIAGQAAFSCGWTPYRRSWGVISQLH